VALSRDALDALAPPHPPPPGAPDLWARAPLSAEFTLATLRAAAPPAAPFPPEDPAP